MNPLFPNDWYWRRDDGQFFASALGAVVGETDPRLVAWIDAGGRPTRWPEDGSGAQSAAALQDVLGPHGFWVDLVAYAAAARWRKEASGVVVAGVPVATDDRSKLMITGARVAAQADPAWSTVWHGADGNTYPVDAVQMIAISDAVQAHVNATFATFAAVKAAIEAGTLTAATEVDAAFATA